MLESHRRGRKTPRSECSALLAAPLLLVPSAVSVVGHAEASAAGSRTLVSEAAAPSAAGGTLFNVQGAWRLLFLIAAPQLSGYLRVDSWRAVSAGVAYYSGRQGARAGTSSAACDLY